MEAWDLRQLFQQPPALGLDFLQRHGQHLISGNFLIDLLGLQVNAQGGLQGRQRQLVDAHRPGQGIFLHDVNITLLAHHNAGLGAAQQLVAAEADNIRSRLTGPLHCGLALNAVSGQVGQSPASQVVNHRQAAPPADFRQLLQGHILSKAHDLIIAGMHLEQRRCLVGNRPLIILGVGFIGGPHLRQSRVALLHNLRHPEGAADFHQLSPGDDHLFILGQGAQNQHDGGGVVVYRKGRFRPGQLAEQAFHMVVAAAPPALAAVVFQGIVIFRHLHGRQRRFMAHPGPAQVGVQHNACAVDHRPQVHAAVFLGDFQRQGRRRFRRELWRLAG